MHSPAFAMKAQQNNCLNITLKFITCRNTRGFQYMQIQKHITLKIGNVFGSKFENKAQMAGGIILILLGTKILLEHLGVV